MLDTRSPLSLYSRLRRKTASNRILFTNKLNKQTRGSRGTMQTAEAKPLMYRKWLLLAQHRYKLLLIA